MNKGKINIGHFRAFVKSLVFLFTTVVFLVASLFLLLFYHTSVSSWFDNNDKQVDTLYVEAEKKLRLTNEVASFWKAADINLVTDEVVKQELEYGKDLISHTAKYLGPNGSVKKISNGMNCSNCHLDAGTKAWGNNYGSVFSQYPKMRGRSGQIEGVYKRINDCLERSLNGSHLKEEDKEMKAMIAYIEYIGKDVPKGEDARASGIYDLEFLDRAADPSKGKTIYDAKCAS